MRALVYGVTQSVGQFVEADGLDYEVIDVEPAPERGYDGLNQWEGSGGVYTLRACWVTLEPLTDEQSAGWHASLDAAADERFGKANRPWWRVWA